MSSLVQVDAESLPRSLTFDPPLTDAELEAFCHANDNVRFERTREGAILMNPPAGGLSGDAKAEIIRQLRNWWTVHRKGRVFDSKTGFYLPDGSMLSPDAAYIEPGTLRGLTRVDLAGFPRVCPDFVIELFSQWDSLAKTRKKMELWIANGAALGWLIVPNEKSVWIYEPGAETVVASGKSIGGIGPVADFTLDLGGIWRCYEL